MNILVGISGGIAAYKVPELVRRLRDHGHEIRIVMTEGAQAFITPLTLQAVSGNPVATDLLDEQAEAAMGHIELARWADAVLIAPATADLIARMAGGLANDLLTTLCLATAAPVAVAPAMNQQMWAHPATQENILRLSNQGVTVYGPAEGEQACGDVGPGRMLEPAELLTAILDDLLPSEDLCLKGKNILITAGPTQEAIDPVRYLTNRSSGKMGFALAEAAMKMGAKVTLVSGPVQLNSAAAIKRIDVISAEDMLQAVMSEVDHCDAFIGCAAVADYRVQNQASQKIKKDNEQLVLTMVENPDIIASVAQLENKPLCVGFAAETENLAEYAEQKLKRKGLDMICANDVSRADIGFDAEQNHITVFTKEGQPMTLETAPKPVIAKKLMRIIAEQLGNN